MIRLACLAVLILLFAPAATAQHSAEVRAAWGFERSDLVPHPRVRFGVLPNGMRYAILANAEPAGGLSIRLRLDVGATAEEEGEQGLMHLLEHMVFEGTRRLPHRRLISRLERAGLERWSDFGAATYPHDTVYRLDLGRSDAQAVGTGMEVMEQVATGLLFSRELIERAKIRVRVEGERRSVAERIADAQTGFFMPGTPVAERPAHGDPDRTRRATPSALRRLYRRLYVPQRATLIVVGAVDPDNVEAAIAARFGSWRPRPSPIRDLSPRIDARRTSEVRTFIDPQAPTAVTIASVAPIGGEADAAAPRDRAFLAHLGCRMLARRLASASGECTTYAHFGTARIARLDVPAPGRDWRGALATARQALRSALEHGFSAQELAEETAAMLRSQAQPDSSSAALADAMAVALQAGTIFTEPQGTGGLQAYLATIRVEAVNAAFRSAWTGQSGRLLFVAHNEAIAEPPAALD